MFCMQLIDHNSRYLNVGSYNIYMKQHPIIAFNGFLNILEIFQFKKKECFIDDNRLFVHISHYIYDSYLMYARF